MKAAEGMQEVKELIHDSIIFKNTLNRSQGNYTAYFKVLLSLYH